MKEASCQEEMEQALKVMDLGQVEEMAVVLRHIKYHGFVVLNGSIRRLDKCQIMPYTSRCQKYRSLFLTLRVRKSELFFLHRCSKINMPCKH